MKQLRKLLFPLLVLTLVCSLLFGCTPKPSETSNEVSLPGLEDQNGTTSSQKNGTADPANIESESLAEDPAETDIEDDEEEDEEGFYEVDGNVGFGGN